MLGVIDRNNECVTSGMSLYQPSFHKASKEALVGPCSETCILRCCHMNELAMTHSSKAI